MPSPTLVEEGDRKAHDGNEFILFTTQILIGYHKATLYQMSQTQAGREVVRRRTVWGLSYPRWRLLDEGCIREGLGVTIVLR